MSATMALMGELTQEAAVTRRMLEALPEDRFDYKPHEKSMDLASLAMHMAQIPGWGATTLSSDELDVTQADQAERPSDVATVLARFDEGVTAFRAALEKASADDLQSEWKLKNGDQVMFTLPRGAVLRSMILNHMIHHRAQLQMYFRLLDRPVPAVYGPTADDPTGAS